jgi:hypothetical protein
MMDSALLWASKGVEIHPEAIKDGLDFEGFFSLLVLRISRNSSWRYVSPHLMQICAL